MSTSFSSPAYDVIVVGMGPAGASAAYELSQGGLSVLAFDKQAHPRYKVCGGGLSARITKILPDDFLSVVEQSVNRVRFTYGEQESFLIQSSEPIAYMVMRQNFDQWLVEKARQVGTVIHEDEAVLEIQSGDQGVDVLTKEKRYRSRVVIGADGVMSSVAQQCFPRRFLRNIPALESEVPGESLHAFQQTPTALISLQAAKKGYGWIFPKQQGLSLGVGEFVKGTKRPKQSFRDFIDHEALLSGLMVPAPMGYPIPVASAQAYRKRQAWAGRLVCGRTMLVGDAGHLVDPLLGEGIYYAIRSGQLAARSVIDMVANPSTHRLSDYERFVENEFGQEFRVAGRLGKIIYGLPRSTHRWAGQRFPGAYQRVLHRYCEVLQGKETYQSLWNRILQRMYWPFA